jgi:hypothetical protein
LSQGAQAGLLLHSIPSPAFGGDSLQVVYFRWVIHRYLFHFGVLRRVVPYRWAVLYNHTSITSDECGAGDEEELRGKKKKGSEVDHRHRLLFRWRGLSAV